MLTFLDLFVLRANPGTDDYMLEYLSSALGVEVDVDQALRAVKPWFYDMNLAQWWPSDALQAIKDIYQTQSEAEFDTKLSELDLILKRHFKEYRIPKEDALSLQLNGLLQGDKFSSEDERILSRAASFVARAFGSSSEYAQTLVSRSRRSSIEGFKAIILQVLDLINKTVEEQQVETTPLSRLDQIKRAFNLILPEMIEVPAMVFGEKGTGKIPELLLFSKTGKRGLILTAPQLASGAAHEYTHALIRMEQHEAWDRSNTGGTVPEDWITMAIGLLAGQQVAVERGDDQDSWAGENLGTTMDLWVYKRGLELGSKNPDEWSSPLEELLLQFPEHYYSQGLFLGGIARAIGERVAKARKAPVSAYDEAANFLIYFFRNAQGPDLDELPAIAKAFIQENITNVSAPLSAVPASPTRGSGIRDSL